MLTIIGADALLFVTLPASLLALLLGFSAGALLTGRGRLRDLRYFHAVFNKQWGDIAALLGDLALALAAQKSGGSDVERPVVQAADTDDDVPVAAQEEIETPPAAPEARCDVVGRGDDALADRIYQSIFGDPPPGRSAAADLDGFRKRQEGFRRESEAARVEGEEAARSIRSEERERSGETASSALRRASGTTGSGKLSATMVDLMRLLSDGEVHSVEDIVRAVPGISTTASASTSISLLRSKVKDRAITIDTVRGQGYRISPVTLPTVRELVATLSPAEARA